MKLQELNIQELESRLEMSVTAEKESVMTWNGEVILVVNP
jgi:hypothetical protein